MLKRGPSKPHEMEKRPEKGLTNTGRYVMTFEKETLPTKLKVGLVLVPVETYYPAPTQCSKCLKMDHHVSVCHRDTTQHTPNAVCYMQKQYAKQRHLNVRTAQANTMRKAELVQFIGRSRRRSNTRSTTMFQDSRPGNCTEFEKECELCAGSSNDPTGNNTNQRPKQADRVARADAKATESNFEHTNWQCKWFSEHNGGNLTSTKNTIKKEKQQSRMDFGDTL